MKSLAPGLRELARVSRRLFDRAWLVGERRKLARLETALGLLGWQQADFDDSTQAHVNQLMDAEREQARLTNESAALGLRIEELEKRRGGRQREHDEARAEALLRELPGVKDERQLEAEIANTRKRCRETEALLPAIDRRLGEEEGKYRALVEHEDFSQKHKDELLELRRVILALPREKAEWERKLAVDREKLRAMEDLAGRLRAAQARFDEEESRLVAEISGCQRDKQRLEKRVDALEKAKADPYREIGRVLGDHQIAPLNQPEALAAVLRQRQEIARREAAVAASLASSASEDRVDVQHFWMLAGGLVFAAGVVILAIVAQ